MALNSSSIGFFLSFLLIFRFVWGQNQTKSNCTKSFECGKLGVISYPFSTDPNCGLCIVDCDTVPDPRIKLSSDGGPWYITKLHNNTISIDAPLLKDPNCYSFYNLSLPSSPSISFTVPLNITLFKCVNFTLNQSLDAHFSGYEKFTNCNEIAGFDIYYKLDRDYSGLGTLPSTCTMIQMPSIPFDQTLLDTTDVYELIASEFDLEWYLSNDCSKCYQNGGQCLIDIDFNFNCSVDISIKGSRDFHMIIGIGGAALILIICFTFVITRHRKKKMVTSSNISSRNTSSTSGPLKMDGEFGSVYPGVPVFSYSELEEVTNNFDSSKELGDGGFGVVYYGKLRDGREVAVKRLYEHTYTRLKQFMNEIKILTALKHPNLVILYGCTSRHSRELVLVYEYIPNGTVFDHLHGDRLKYKLLDWPLRMNIAIETASALRYLHRSEIIHRDVKTNNILLDHKFSVKVADFGISRLFPNDVTHVSTGPQGTPGYVDPEYHECYRLTSKSDVYSFGVVLIELISSKPAVDMTRHRQEINLGNLAINKIQRCEFDELIDSSLGYETDPEIKRMTMLIAELAFRCLQFNSELRPNMDEVWECLKNIKGETNNKSRRCSESDDAALLNTRSPNTVTEAWNTCSSTISDTQCV